jgi:hypothetical protein
VVKETTKHVLYEAPAKPEMIVANPLADIVKPIEPKAEITPEPIVEVASEPVTLVNPVNEVPTIEEEIVRFELTLEEDIEDIINNDPTIDPIVKKDGKSLKDIAADMQQDRESMEKITNPVN